MQSGGKHICIPQALSLIFALCGAIGAPINLQTLAAAQAQETSNAMPAPAPDLAPKPASENKYVKQSAVLDVATPDAKPATKSKPPAKAFKNDFDLVASLSVPGWEGQETIRLRASKNSLAGADGKIVDEIQGKPSAILTEYGCMEAITRRFKRGQRFCDCAILRFAQPDGAYGAYTTMRSGSSTVVVRGQGSSEDEDSISFFSANALVFLRSTAPGDDEAKGMLGFLEDQITPHLSGGAPAPHLISSLPYIERVSGSEKFFMGSKSASHYCTFQFLESLLLDQSHGAACADYAYSRPMAERLKLLVVEYANQAAAQGAFNTYSTTMSAFSKKTLDKGTNETRCKMSDSYLMCGLNGSRVFVIAGARRAASPNVLARELIQP